MEVRHVAAVLAVHAHRDPGEPRGDRRLQSGQVARVHDRRRKFAEKSEQARVEPHAMAGSLVQREVLDVAASDSSSEIGDVGERNNRVSKRLRWQMVDKIDDAVLESADIESVNHVGDQGPIVCPCRNPGTHHCVRAASRKAASMGSRIAVVKACSVARACASSRSVGVKTTTHAAGSP